MLIYDLCSESGDFPLISQWKPVVYLLGLHRIPAGMVEIRPFSRHPAPAK